MRIPRRVTASAAVLGVALTAVLVANTEGQAATQTARPCTIGNVSYYFGGYFEGLGKRSIDVTLVAHAGVTCALSDTPLISFTGASTPVPVQVQGRGGTLVLSQDSPLHATIGWLNPDTPTDGIKVSTMSLAMPDNSTRNTSFPCPFGGDTEIYREIDVTSWDTGMGRGEGE